MTSTRLDGLPTHVDLDALDALVAKATPGPWRWWTSNSHARLSSDATSKDGDVICAVRASDGLPVLSVTNENMAGLTMLGYSTEEPWL